MPTLLALLLTLARAETAARCPEDTAPVRTADPALPWACAAAGADDAEDCPRGFESAVVLDRAAPYRCVVAGLSVSPPRGLCPAGHRPAPSSDPERAYECEKAERAESLPCRRGTRPVRTKSGLSPFRCEAAPAAARRPSAGVCPPGTRRRQTEDPFEPVVCVAPASEAADAPGPLRFRRFGARAELSFEYPSGWHVTDAWKDEVPSILVFRDSGRDGRPIHLSVSRHVRGQSDFLPLEEAMEKERRWRGAQDEAGRRVAGRAARLQSVPGESSSAFLPLPDGYLHLTYSAPAEDYDRHRPAYLRLLDTLELGGSAPGSAGSK